MASDGFEVIGPEDPCVTSTPPSPEMALPKLVPRTIADYYIAAMMNGRPKTLYPVALWVIFFFTRTVYIFYLTAYVAPESKVCGDANIFARSLAAMLFWLVAAPNVLVSTWWYWKDYGPRLDRDQWVTNLVTLDQHMNSVRIMAPACDLLNVVCFVMSLFAIWTATTDLGVWVAMAVGGVLFGAVDRVVLERIESKPVELDPALWKFERNSRAPYAEAFKKLYLNAAPILFVVTLLVLGISCEE